MKEDNKNNTIIIDLNELKKQNAKEVLSNLHKKFLKENEKHFLKLQEINNKNIKQLYTPPVKEGIKNIIHYAEEDTKKAIEKIKNLDVSFYINPHKKTLENMLKEYNPLENLKKELSKIEETLNILNPEQRLKEELSKIDKNIINKVIQISIPPRDYLNKQLSNIFKIINKDLSSIQEFNKKISPINTDENYPLQERALFLHNTALMIEEELKEAFKSRLALEILEAIIFNLQNFYIDSTLKSHLKTSSIAYFLKELKEANLNILAPYKNNSFVYIALFEIIEEILNFIEKLEEIIKECEYYRDCFINSFNFALEKTDVKKFTLLKEVYKNNLVSSKYKRIAGIINYIAQQNNIPSSNIFKLFSYLAFKKSQNYLHKKINQYKNLNLKNIF